ncbi:MAG TPA: hypothetical protein VK052_00085 [Zeimonas sp.]|nr:hypothetical protein [Zeimonas sp.]
MADLELLHLVARAAAGARPFEHRVACADLWARLGRTFDLVACVLMPNHVHVLAQLERDAATKAFARVLSAFRLRMRALRTAPIEFDWEPLPRPEKVQRDKRHIARTVRYIHLNPSRDALCGNPLEWEWSTHRDWVGAVARPCVDRSRWARAMGRHPRTCAEWLHQYVSSDTSVRDASPLADPRPFLADEPKDASIDALATAVVLVLRSAAVAPAEFGPAERRLFLLSAARWTRYRAPELARHVHRHRTNAWRAMRAGIGERAKPSGADDAPVLPERLHALNGDELRAMALVLADRRLSTSQLRGALPERARTRQHRAG